MKRIEGRAFGIIVAAGNSTRMGGADKVFAPLVGRPLLAWTLLAFRKCDDIDGIVIVAPRDRLERMRAFAAEWRITKVVDVVAGGATRQGSVRAGVDAADGAAIVVIHDAARPLVTPELISQGIELARESGAAICAMPSRDTVKEVDTASSIVRRTLDRDEIWLAQTPQVFARELLLEAHAKADSAATDDAALVEAIGRDVRVYEGDRGNLKVTVQDDIVVAEALLRARLERG